MQLDDLNVLAAFLAVAEERSFTRSASAYFDAYPKPKSPRDLTKHRCLNFRHGADET